MTRDLMALPFDQYQRYKVVQEIATVIKGTTGQARLKVLDVGGWPGLIVNSLPHEYTVILDICPCDKQIGGKKWWFTDWRDE